MSALNVDTGKPNDLVAEVIASLVKNGFQASLAETAGNDKEEVH
jgi:hypothetical protein